jgi:hypothetical protein
MTLLYPRISIVYSIDGKFITFGSPLMLSAFYAIARLEGWETGIVGEDNRTAFSDSGCGSEYSTAPHAAKNLLAVKLVPKKWLRCSWKQLPLGAP